MEVHSDEEEYDEDKYSAEEFYKEWIVCQNKYTVKTISIILMNTVKERFGITDVAAASEAGLVVGHNEKTIHTWRKDFYENSGEFTESLPGKHDRPYVMDDENCQKKALDWLHDRAYTKEQPSITAATFASWVNTDLLPNTQLPPVFPHTITPQTARKWLHDPGFLPKLHKKDYILMVMKEMM